MSRPRLLLVHGDSQTVNNRSIRPGTSGALFVHPRGAHEVDNVRHSARASRGRQGIAVPCRGHGNHAESRDGHGGEREVVEQYRGSSLVLEFHDKVKIEMACSEPFVEATIQAIVDAARTGDVGDGKIFVQPLERVVRIRTGETNNDALTPVTADEVQARAKAELPAVGA